MKLFNASNLDSGIKQVKQSIDTLENQLQDLRKQIDYFTGLDDNFTGKSGNSIRMFYQEVHIPFILLFEQTIRQYKAALNVAEKLFFLFEPADDGYIEESFLETEIEQGLKKAAEITHQLVEDVNDALGSIRDIMSIKHLTDENFYMDVQRAKRFTQRTINQLHQTDHGRAQDLTDTETDLQLLQKYITEIRSMFQSKDVTISNYTFRKFATNATYKEVLSEIEQNAHYTLDELYGTSPYLPNTYVEARYPGPNAHLDMLMKNRYRDSIEDRIEAANIISELTDTKITKEEFESLEERLVDMVEIKNGVDSVEKYYLYDDGLIVKVSSGTYEFVQSIPGRDTTNGEITYDFSEYDKKFVGNMWMLSKNGTTGQDAAGATIAYNEAIKSGKIKPEVPQTVDINLEQIEAAKEGYNYWTGEKISDVTKYSIIVGGVFSSFSGFRGGRVNINTSAPPKTITVPKKDIPKIKEKVKGVEGNGVGNKGTGKVQTRTEIMNTVQSTMSPAVKKIKGIDPDAKVGYRGSLATGQKGPHKGNAPFDPTDFDIDAFIVSDKLASKFKPEIKWRSGTRINEIEQLQIQIDKSLKESLPGMRKVNKRGRPDNFTFRIYTQEEYNHKFNTGTQIIND
ncbi:LXG domain-containing protein [Metabacillus niabensis]|uniref:LXG domain-containing protein n=1 Tax=Metabacillus niabensis TaxID=324854 RepID=A0ABT9Z658_9BACI|nr:LXG domain-containing protein [Metabacillus niabensis]MDQ0227741.1 hypothetical protein [Metabacillus niabensis]